MATPIKSSLTLFRYSTVSFADIATNGKVIMCAIDDNWDTEADVVDIDTKCGLFRDPQGVVHTIAQTGMNVGDLAANEVSAMDLKRLIQAGTKVFFEYANATDGGDIAKGDGTYCAGEGYFTKCNIQNNKGDAVSRFDWEFAVSGTPDLTA